MFSIIQAAGWPIWPLIICSIVALAVVVERLSSLRAARVIPPRLLDEVLSVTRANLPSPDVVNKLADNSILGRVLAGGVRAVIADPRITEEALRGTLESAGRAAVHRMERYLNTLGTIASAAPYLGLLGTVTGMIVTFQAITIFGAGDPKAMANGISQALVTTVQGLCVAIPIVLAHTLVGNRAGIAQETTAKLKYAHALDLPLEIARQIRNQSADQT